MNYLARAIVFHAMSAKKNPKGELCNGLHDAWYRYLLRSNCKVGSDAMLIFLSTWFQKSRLNKSFLKFGFLLMNQRKRESDQITSLLLLQARG